MNKEDALNEIGKLGYKRSQTGYSNGELSFVFGVIPSENKQMQNSKFYSDETEFIHFTSIEGLTSIINSKCFRLYNFQNMDDVQEMSWASKMLKFTEELKNEDKEELYCFSMTSQSIIRDLSKKHLLWKIHGRDGKGILLKLKIVNDPLSWYNFHLVKVLYNHEEAKAIAYINENEEKIILDQKICSFIKNPIYNFEEETRIIFENRTGFRITYSKDDKIQYPITFNDKLLNNKNIKYFEIPISNFINDDNEYRVTTMYQKILYKPKIEISEIVLGYRYSEIDLKNLILKIRTVNKDIKVSHSLLKKDYSENIF